MHPNNFPELKDGEDFVGEDKKKDSIFVGGETAST
jgi:hypothetical protein